MATVHATAATTGRTRPGARRRVAGDEHRQQMELRLQRVAVGERVDDDDGGEDPRRVHPPQRDGTSRPHPGDHKGVRVRRRPPPLAEQVERREPRDGDGAAGKQILDHRRASSPPAGHDCTVPTFGAADIGRMAGAHLRPSMECPRREPPERLARRPMRPTAGPARRSTRDLPRRAAPIRPPPTVPPAANRPRRAGRRARALLAARLAAGATAEPAGAIGDHHHSARTLDGVNADRPPPRTRRRVRAGAGRAPPTPGTTSRSPPASGPPRSRPRCSRPRSPSGARWKRRCGGSSRPTGRCTCRAWPSTSATAPPPTGSPSEGAHFGLCQTLAWEWWHFEWRERWEAAGACPAPAQIPEDAPPP